MHIRIISTPLGDAPDYIRQGWIGQVLPADRHGIQRRRTVSIFSRRRSFLAFFLARFLHKTRWETGYVVNAARAVEILAKTSPDLAQWWRQKAPFALGPKQIFLFNPAACEEVSPPIRAAGAETPSFRPGVGRNRK